MSNTKELPRLTTEQLTEMFAEDQFSFTVDVVEEDRQSHDFEVGEDTETGETEYRTQYTAWVRGEAVAANPNGIKIAFHWAADAQGESVADSYDYKITLDDNQFIKIEGAVLVDEDGDIMPPGDVDEFLIDELTGRAWEDQVSELLPVLEPVQVDQSVSDAGEEHELYDDNGPNLKFRGSIVAEAGTWWENGTKKDLKIYKTAGGSFVCQKISWTRWQGSRDRFKCAVVKTHNEIIEFFGYGDLAKELYQDAGIDATRSVE